MDVSGFTEGELNGAELKVQIGFYDLYYKDKLYTGTCGCYVSIICSIMWQLFQLQFCYLKS